MKTPYLIKTTWTGIFLLSFCFSSFSQKEWDKAFKYNIFNDAKLIKTAQDSSIWVCGLSDSGKAAVSDSVYLAKFDADGILKKIKTIGSANNPFFMATTPDKGVVIAADSTLVTDVHSILLSKYNSTGDLLWHKKITSETYCNDYHFSVLSDGKILSLSGKNHQINVFNSDGTLFLTKNILDSSASHTYIQAVNSNDFILSAYQKDSLQEYKIDYSGAILSKTNISQLDSSYFEKINRLKNGAYVILHDGLLSCYQNKQKTWEMSIEKSVKGDYFFRAYNLVIDKNDNIIIVGAEAKGSMSNENTTALILILDKNGNLKSNKRFKGQFNNDFSSITESLDGYYLACGWKNSKLQMNGAFASFNATSSARIVKTKADDFTNLIYGKVIVDENKDCKKDSLEKYLKSAITIAKNTQNEVLFGTTDQNGNYQILVDTGTYTMNVVLPSPYFGSNCVNNKVVFTGKDEKKLHDFLLQKNINCSFLTIDLATLGIRPCSQNTFVVRYCNKGTNDAQNAYIDLSLDSKLTFESANLVHVALGNNKYRFNLGTVKTDTCQVFVVKAKSICDDALAGKTLCNTAHIYPDSICGINDGFIDVKAICKFQNIDFQIINNSDKSMTTPKNYLVIEDDIMLKNANFQLGANAIETITIAAKAGKTYRIIAEQTNPLYGTVATDALESCLVSTPTSLGFINQFSLGDDVPFEDVDCRQVTNSFGPNDKQGLPIGLKNQHFIPKNTDIEYLIRFQNLGTDTAFTVVVKDTLSAFLDAPSIQVGASSHPYSFELNGKGIATFTFDKINLPHLKVDKNGSMGFVKFRIKQRGNNPNGTIITNNTAIIFDSNKLILTNSTVHTIAENWVKLTPVQEFAFDDIGLKIFPNPFRESLRIEVEKEYSKLTFSLFDVSGKQIRQEQFEGQTLDFQRNNLNRGFYFYQIKSDNRVIGVGKVIVE